MARLYEYQGKEMLEKMGIPVPQGRCVTTAEDAKQVASEIGKPVVIKAQVWATGRFKAGGIKFADTPEEAENIAKDLIGREIKGLKVEKILVEEQLEVERELYGGIIVSSSHKVKGPVLIFSSEGGSSIEEVSARNPERIASLDVDYINGVTSDDVKKMMSDIVFKEGDLSESLFAEVAEVVSKIYKAFVEYDARSLEVNPIIITKDQRVIAADCHYSLDDSSAFRHPEFGIVIPRDMTRPPTKLEEDAWMSIEDEDYRGTGYFAQMAVDIEGSGWLGFQGIGGGGAMLGASAFVERGFKIATYADTSGEPPASKIYLCIKAILSLPVDGYVLMGACLANQEQWHHAHALVKIFKEFAKEKPGFPVIMLLAGNKEEEAHQIIKDGFKDLPLRWELYGREYIYDTNFIADRVEAVVKEYQEANNII
jgi:succinyl-CoA synthetase beta subunit